MRLICPNCDAEYEVDASVIPDSGRDVQCSNCGHTWFQLPPSVETELAAEAALYEPPAPVEAPLPPPVAEPDLPEPEPAAPPPPPRSIDESVLAVLREEAEREAEARKSEPPPVIETQVELGLAPAGQAVATANHLAKLRGEDLTPAKPLTRREMLPEIEELNSTLRSSSEKRDGDLSAITDAEEVDRPKRSGFRSGFTLMILIAVVMTVLYIMTPRLAEQFPAAAGALKAYVAWVDQMRLGLDRMIKSAIAFLRGLTGSAG